jgi:hypothetical protein
MLFKGGWVKPDTIVRDTKGIWYGQKDMKLDSELRLETIVNRRCSSLKFA